MEEIGCIFCANKNAQTVIEENGYKGRKCLQCGLIYISPRPTFDEIMDLYRHDNAHASAESHISAGVLKRLYAKHSLEIINSFITNGAILDIGAGAGYFLDEARKRGFDPYGIELNNILANHIKNTWGIPCEESPLGSSSFGGKRFDVIHHCDVISHFFDPISEFQKVAQALRENGLLVFQTGNFAEVEQRYFRYIQRFEYPDHLFLFSVDNLRHLVEETGFEFLKVYRYSILPELIINKGLRRLVGAGKSKNRTMCPGKRKSGASPPMTISKVKGAVFNLKGLLRMVYWYFNYFVRYKVGYIVPKEGRPQTVIVVARKRN